VFSSLGLYPYMSGGQFFAMTTPQFPHVVMHIADGPQQGGTLRIDAPGAGADAGYITAARVDGKPSTKSWVPDSAVLHGGTISLTVSVTAGTWGTGQTDQPPSVDNDGSLPPL
jgi:putative alpha-1,2-mannosidase